MSVRLELTAAQKSKVREKMNRLVLQNRKGLVNAMSAAGLDMQNKAKETSPLKTSRLRQSIRKETIDNGLGVKISTNVVYAVYQNNGTSRIAGKRFMEQGFEAGVRRLLRTLRIK